MAHSKNKKLKTMFKASFLILAATFAPQALAVCSTGDLAIGITENFLGTLVSVTSF